MKILHLIYDDIDNPWLGGGGAFRTFEIYRRLAEDHDIMVITGNYPNAEKEEEKEGVFYKRVGSNKSYFLSRLTYTLTAPKFVKKLDYDLLIEDFSAFSPCLSPVYTKKPIIASIQSLCSKYAIRKYRLFGVIPFLFEKLGLKLYRNFIVVSDGINNQLKIGISKNCRIKVIPNSVDKSLFSLRSSEENFILFLGRIDIYLKGIDVLLEAFSKIKNNCPGTRLIIAGGGKDVDRLEKSISRLEFNNIEYVGRVLLEEKGALLSKCLFVCMPSRFEARPIVAVEAAACEKPVIGTKIPGLLDSIRDAETGILVEPNNANQLASAIMKLVGDKRLRRKLGKNAREWASKFDWDEIAKTQERFYFECLTSF